MNRILQLALILFAGFYNGFAQTATEREKTITARYDDYFKSDREKIHLHLNKTVYLTNESIWFKGYFTEEKNKTPIIKNSTIYIDLLDETGARIQSELCYASFATLEGYIPLSDKIKSGTYFIRAYTNFMNNYTEDESALYTVTIINPSDTTPLKDRSKVNLKALSVQFFPESGVFLENAANTIALKITDCNDNPIAVTAGSVINNKGEAVTRFSTNENGIGRFDLLQNNNAPYTVVFTVGNTTQSFPIPTPKTSGYAFSINNYTFSDKALLTLKTTTATPSDVSLSLIIQQDGKVGLIENLTLKKGTASETFTINHDHFYDGINTLTLIDQNNKKIAERILFKPYALIRNTIITATQKRADSLFFQGKSNIPLGSLSISVVPEQSVATGNSRSLYDTFVFSPYLENPLVANTAYYLNDFSKNKHYELDTYLITQKAKYNSDTILNTPPPTIKYEPETGITLKGTINKPLSNRSRYFVEMKAFYNSIKKEAEINDKNEFIFTNLIAYDSTRISFTLHNRNGTIENLPMSIQVIKNQNLFLKPLPKLSFRCPEDSKTETVAFQLPEVRDMKAILLDDVTITKKPKAPVLKNIRKFSNSMAKGYGSSDFTSYREVLSFIAAHGFDVIYKNGEVSINNRIVRSFRGNPSPAVFVDDVPLQPDLNMLVGMGMELIEEIYISKSGYGMGMDGGNGYIRIYTKRYMGTETVKSKAQQYVVKKAAQSPKDFKNPHYINYDEGFSNYGTINWIPEVRTDQHGNFSFSIPNCNQKSVNVKIEGIGSDGELISEEKTIPL